jgi:hypothetical protein
MTIKNYDYHSTEHSKTQEIIFTLITAHATLCQILHHLAGQNQVGYEGDKGCATGNIPAVGAVALGAGRADAVRPTAGGHVLNRAKRLLLGIDGLSFPDVPLFQLPAHDPRPRINPGLVDIRHPGRGKALHGVSASSSSVLENGFSIPILRYS